MKLNKEERVKHNSQLSLCNPATRLPPLIESQKLLFQGQGLFFYLTDNNVHHKTRDKETNPIVFCRV